MNGRSTILENAKISGGSDFSKVDVTSAGQGGIAVTKPGAVPVQAGNPTFDGLCETQCDAFALHQASDAMPPNSPSLFRHSGLEVRNGGQTPSELMLSSHLFSVVDNSLNNNLCVLPLSEATKLTVPGALRPQSGIATCGNGYDIPQSSLNAEFSSYDRTKSHSSVCSPINSSFLPNYSYAVPSVPDNSKPKLAAVNRPRTPGKLPPISCCAHEPPGKDLVQSVPKHALGCSKKTPTTCVPHEQITPVDHTVRTDKTAAPQCVTSYPSLNQQNQAKTSMTNSNLAVGYFMPPPRVALTKGIYYTSPADPNQLGNNVIANQPSSPYRMHLDILPSPHSCSNSPLDHNILSPCSSNISSISLSQYCVKSNSQDIDGLFNSTEYPVKDSFNSTKELQTHVDPTIPEFSAFCVDEQQFLQTSQDTFGGFLQEPTGQLFGSAAHNLVTSIASSVANSAEPGSCNTTYPQTSICLTNDIAVSTDNFVSTNFERPIDHFSVQNGCISEPSLNIGGINLQVADQVSPHSSDISLLLPSQTSFSPLGSEASGSLFHSIPKEPTDTLSPSVKPEDDTNWVKFSFLPATSQNQPVSLIGDNQEGTMGAGSITTPLFDGQNSLSPLFPINLMDISPGGSSFASPRNSAKSSHSGGLYRNKRALSISPLSDITAIIRSSPTSLVAYINGSRSSSASMSPAPGGYGHLSARNSSSSPHSGSASSGRRQSIACTPQHSASLAFNNDTRETSTKSEDVLETGAALTCTQMQSLETGYQTVLPEEQTCENHVVLPRSFDTVTLDRLIYPAEPVAMQPTIPATLPPVPNHPPPSYEKIMEERRKSFQKKNSSDSSHPSDHSSFDSFEGGGTDSDQGRTQYTCEWIDCNITFQEQDELVQHIEREHIDQRKGEEYACYWGNCERRSRPFNARYKLLMHMRVHSGEKPNKCTHEGCTRAFSRLENLKIHIRSHTGERPYSCPFDGCVKTFSNSSDRAKHLRTHYDQKPYACQEPGCTKRYTDPSSLRKHGKNHGVRSDNTRKKLKGTGTGDVVDPEGLSKCLTIQQIRPQTHSESSPPELVHQDSGLGRSPRASRSELYGDIDHSISLSSNQSSRSGTATCLSNNQSPSSQQGSPVLATPSERKYVGHAPHTNYRPTPMFPPIVQTVSAPVVEATRVHNQRQPVRNKTNSLSKSANDNGSMNTGGFLPSLNPPLRSTSSTANQQNSYKMTSVHAMGSSFHGLRQTVAPSPVQCRNNVFPPFEDAFSPSRFAFESHSGGVS